jgi:hypothetical protein
MKKDNPRIVFFHLFFKLRNVQHLAHFRIVGIDALSVQTSVCDKRVRSETVTKIIILQWKIIFAPLRLKK